MADVASIQTNSGSANLPDIPLDTNHKAFMLFVQFCVFVQYSNASCFQTNLWYLNYLTEIFFAIDLLSQLWPHGFESGSYNMWNPSQWSHTILSGKSSLHTIEDHKKYVWRSLHKFTLLNRVYKCLTIVHSYFSILVGVLNQLEVLAGVYKYAKNWLWPYYGK